MLFLFSAALPRRLDASRAFITSELPARLQILISHAMFIAFDREGLGFPPFQRSIMLGAFQLADVLRAEIFAHPDSDLLHALQVIFPRLLSLLYFVFLRLLHSLYFVFPCLFSSSFDHADSEGKRYE
jgi:hypothetical protein